MLVVELVGVSSSPYDLSLNEHQETELELESPPVDCLFLELPTKKGGIDKREP